MVELPAALIGIESKRYEPFRSRAKPKLSDAYWRPVWGDNMSGYCRVRDDIRAQSLKFERLDAAQLVKHAFGLRTTAHRASVPHYKIPMLLYLYAEPTLWPDGRRIPPEHISQHRREIDEFALRVIGDEVRFLAISYSELLNTWKRADAQIARHAEAIESIFSP